MIRRLAAFVPLATLVSACCCPRAERRCAPCGPSDNGPVVTSNVTNFDFVLDPPVRIQDFRGVEIVLPSAPPPPPDSGVPRVELGISKLEINVPADSPIFPADDAKLVLQIHVVVDLTAGDSTKIDHLVELLRPVVLSAGGSVAAQGTIQIIVKGTRRDQSAVAAMLRDMRAFVGLPPPPAAPPPVKPPDPK